MLLFIISHAKYYTWTNKDILDYDIGSAVNCQISRKVVMEDLIKFEGRQLTVVGGKMFGMSEIRRPKAEPVSDASTKSGHWHQKHPNSTQNSRASEHVYHNMSTEGLTRPHQISVTPRRNLLIGNNRVSWRSSYKRPLPPCRRSWNTREKGPRRLQLQGKLDIDLQVNITPKIFNMT